MSSNYETGNWTNKLIANMNTGSIIVAAAAMAIRH